MSNYPDIEKWEVEHARYFIRRGGKGKWKPATLEEWCAAEREAGFYPKPGCGPAATAGFSTTDHGEIEGRIEYV